MGSPWGAYVDEGAGSPVDLEVEVHEVFAGEVPDIVTVNTWGSDEAWDPTGTRMLAAMGETMDLMACGFTQPYSAVLADEWRELLRVPNLSQ